MNLTQLARDIADLAHALDNRIRITRVLLDADGKEIGRISRSWYVPAPRTKERNQ